MPNKPDAYSFIQDVSGSQKPIQGRLDVDFVLPAYNEQDAIVGSVDNLLTWLEAHASYTWRITIADNASSDLTLLMARELMRKHPWKVGILHLDKKGRGRALKEAWMTSGARVVAYMDVDLSTDLNAISMLVNPLLTGDADIAIGSRLSVGSQVQRSVRRELISRTYNRMLRLTFKRWRYDLDDAQCGFKAITSSCARILLPKIEDNEWFFDTECLVLACANNLRVLQVPVLWKEDKSTTVNIPYTVIQDLAGMKRMVTKLHQGLCLPLN
jgi:glycosyltransferase involved in cell wall biosynthesis